MPDARAIALQALAEAERAVEAWRAVLAAMDCPSETDLAEADFAAENLLGVGEAARRFETTKDCIRRWCRDEGVGVREGGRWRVSLPRLRRHLGL